MDHRRAVYLKLSVIAFLCAVLAKGPYRAYIQSSGVNDYGVSGSLPNFFSPLAGAMLALWLFGGNRFLSERALVLASVAGVVAYEFSQRRSATQVFDWLDVAATILAGGLALMIVTRIGAHTRRKTD